MENNIFERLAILYGKEVMIDAMKNGPEKLEQLMLQDGLDYKETKDRLNSICVNNMCLMDETNIDARILFTKNIKRNYTEMDQNLDKVMLARCKNVNLDDPQQCNDMLGQIQDYEQLSNLQGFEKHLGKGLSDHEVNLKKELPQSLGEKIKNAGRTIVNWGSLTLDVLKAIGSDIKGVFSKKPLELDSGTLGASAAGAGLAGAGAGGAVGGIPDDILNGIDDNIGHQEFTAQLREGVEIKDDETFLNDFLAKQQEQEIDTGIDTEISPSIDTQSEGRTPGGDAMDGRSGGRGE